MARQTGDLVISYDFPPKVGGAHLWLYEVYRRWQSAVVTFTSKYSGAPEEARRQREFDALSHGALVIARKGEDLGEIDLFDVRFLRALRSHVSEIRRIKPGGRIRIHALRAFPEGLVGYIYRKLHWRSCRLITYAHGEEVLVARTSGQLDLIARRVYAGSDLVIVNSESTRRLVLDLCPTARVERIDPGVDLAAFACDQIAVRRYRERWGWTPDTVVVCTLGRLEERKNQAAVVRVIAQLRREGLPVAYVCAGAGQELSSLEKIAADLGIGEYVRFLGEIPPTEKPLLYMASEIFAMPSIRVGSMLEGFGIVFLEAAAAGLPTVCGNTGGQAEAVLNGRTGFSVDGRDVLAIAAAVRMLVCDAELRRNMGQAGRAWAATHDWSLVARRTELAVEGM